jgi:hypothetical protein
MPRGWFKYITDMVPNDPADSGNYTYIGIEVIADCTTAGPGLCNLRLLHIWNPFRYYKTCRFIYQLSCICEWFEYERGRCSRCYGGQTIPIV